MSPTNGGVLFVALLTAMSTVQQPPTGEQPTLVVQTGHVGRINAAAFSSDSRLIATGDHRGSILVWDVESGRQLGALAGHDAGVR
jgi:WD40 repeat protein